MAAAPMMLIQTWPAAELDHTAASMRLWLS